jgi:predicted alpha/beta-fold hydrolase
MAEINLHSLTSFARLITKSIISFSSVVITNSLQNICENEGIYLFTTTSIVQSIFLLYTYNARKKPAFYIKAIAANDKNTKNNLYIRHLINSCPSLLNYSPSILYAFDYVGQLQTAGQTLLKTLGYYLNIGSNLQFYREILTLSDGGSVGLDWVVSLKGYNIEPFFNSKPINPNPFNNKNNNTTKSTNKEDEKPIVIVHHGLCGHSRTEYLVHMVEHLTKLHYKVVVVVGRGCGDIELTTNMPFSFGRTLDYQEVVDYIHSRHPQRQLYSIGYSLGACLTLNYCGRNDKKSPLSGAIAVSPPWDFDVKKTMLFNLIWTKVLVQLIKSYFYMNLSKFDTEVMKLIQSSDSMTSYDEIVCSKFFGFKNRYCFIYLIL